ncbi:MULTISPECIES: acyltransferase [unclassified Gluconobacter]|uniref:acyltransferase family protein n=1 Tax=unclassified Gluconobacter TaxID=2644261 RepID=UPI001C052F51|nr:MULTISPECIES: acyltransferase [unclassified Gluconobacter]
MPLPIPTNMKHLAERNGGIDILRSLAVVLVVIHHVALRIPLTQTGLATIFPLWLLNAFSGNGRSAVTIFFVISGFLITSHTLKQWGTLSQLDWQSFYQRRAARILPCLVTLVVVLSVLDLAQVPDYTIEHTDQSLPRAILAAFGMHMNWYEGQTGYLPGGWDVLWSLSIEEAFYIGFPLFCLITAHFSRFRAFMFFCLAFSMPLSLAALTHASPIWQSKAYLPGMSAIAMGVCSALLAHRVSIKRRTALRSLIGVTGAIVLSSYLINAPFFWNILGSIGALALTISTAFLLIAFSWGWMADYTTRGTKWLRSFGFMSYEIYLSHMFVVFPLITLFRISGGNMYIGWLWFVPAISLSWILGYGVEHLLSRPADRWLRDRPKPQVIDPATT